jgi:hypothetical protein
MRKKRTIYFNDARHYYLFVFEPPMALEDAWMPVDEVAGTAVDTFAYGVERGDGLFYPSGAGLRFGADMRPFPQAAYWRVWHNMQSLIDRGLDPLRVLIDRAHDKGMAFIASLRMPNHGGMNPAHAVVNGGGGLAHPEVRNHQFKVLEELATRYPVDGIELDFALPGGARNIRTEEAEAMGPVLADYVEQIAEMVRAKSGGGCDLGARVYPTEALNRADGLDVHAWLARGCLDYAAPLHYGYFILDPDMPIDWLIEAAHREDTAVYGFLQPYIRDASTGAPEAAYPAPEQIRAAMANYWSKGVDGLYTWFMHWPLGETERSLLTELGDPDLVREKDKHYSLSRNIRTEDPFQYETRIPFEIAATGTPYTVTFYLADDFENAAHRIQDVQVSVKIGDLVTADRLTIRLNGSSLAEEACVRRIWDRITPYNGQWLEFRLKRVRPRQGYNTLEFILESRPADLGSLLRVEEIEVVVRYGIYKSGE